VRVLSLHKCTDFKAVGRITAITVTTVGAGNIRIGINFLGVPLGFLFTGAIQFAFGVCRASSQIDAVVKRLGPVADHPLFI